MIYRTNPKNGDELSQLAFGCMRFTKDEKEVEKQIDYAIQNGVNYFDTAYIYPNSEVTLGRVLSKLGCRSKIKIATKLPHYLIKKYEDLDKIFYTELKRLQTTYIDYYLMHMLTDVNTWNRLVSIGIIKWIEEKKQNGEIINVGFSYHGGKSEFIKIIDSYDWEFCMMQYNFLDENNQAGRSGLEYASSKGLPVMIMEPLRGGRLVNGLPKEVYSLWDNAYIKRSPADWAFRWLWNQSEITTVLSGMNSMEMIEENIRIAGDAKQNSFTEEDFELFSKARKILNEKIKVPCTGCSYCMPCPNDVDIPTCFSCYNNIELESKLRGIVTYVMQTSLKKESHNASRCIKCGKCEEHCPQKIKIREELQNVSKNLEGFFYKPAMFFAKKFMKF